MHKIMALAAALTSVTPALADTVEIKTPSGHVEAIFKGQTAKSTSGLVAGGCMDQGWSVADRDEFHVECRSSSYGTPFNRYTKKRGIYRFNLIEIDGVVRVRGQGSTETTNGFGQVSQKRSTSKDQIMLELLEKVGGSYPPGTTFLGHSLGVDGHVASKAFAPPFYIITAVKLGGAADVAGLIEGDFIKRVNGKRFADENEFHRRLNKNVATGDLLTLRIRRGEERLEITVIAQIRSPVIAPRDGSSSSATPAEEQQPPALRH